MIQGLILQVTQTGSMAADTMSRMNAAAAPAVEQSISLWDLAQKGGPILIPIAVLSIAAIYIFFERFFTIQRFAKVDMNFMNQIRDHVHHGNIEAARALCKATNSPVSRMIEKGLMRLGKPINDIEGAIENVGKLEIYQMEKNMGVLSTIAGLAPMFGFLGTIFGVIKIFYDISKTDNISMGVISGGLYVKMVTSAAGLFVGIVAYVCYHILNMMVDKVILKLETDAIEFIDLLEEPSK